MEDHDERRARLVRMREQAGVRPSQIAHSARVSSVFVAYVEDGTRKPPPHLLRVYARMCGYSEHRLLLEWGHFPREWFALAIDKVDELKALLTG